MPAIRIETPDARLAELALDACMKAGVGAGARNAPVARGLIRHRAKTAPAEVAVLLRIFGDLDLALAHDPAIDAEFVVALPELKRAELGRCRVMVGSDTGRFRKNLTEAYGRLGFGLQPATERPLPPNVIKYGGAHKFALAIVRLQLAARGVEATLEKAWSNSDMDIHVLVSDPDQALKPLAARVPVKVRTDEPGAFGSLQTALAAAGFAQVSIAALEGRSEPRLAVLPGPLARLGGHIETAALAAALDSLVRAAGVDSSRFPIQLPEGVSSGSEDCAEIHLPLAAIRSGEVLPWGHAAPERYEIKILHDEPSLGRKLEARLNLTGFRRTECRRLERIGAGFALRLGSDVPATLREAARRAIMDEMTAAGASGFPLVISDCKGAEIAVEYPAAAFASGRLLAELATATRHSCRVIGPSEAVCKAVADAERKRGWRSLSTSVDTDEDPPQILYGGAHMALIERLQRDIEAAYGFTVPANKQWGVEDMDVFIRLPATLVVAAPEPRAAAVSAASQKTSAPPASSAIARAGRPFVVLTPAEATTGDIVVARRRDHHPRTPDPAQFAELVIDQAAAETLAFLAEAWTQRHHVALEGTTGVSKTYLISYFACLIGAPLFRGNLTATSDALDIIGRIIPDPKRPASFKWIDGALPNAMIEGGILALDEANLAPTELLERCNSALERYPSLVITEEDNRVLSGAIVHSDFRVFASWNGSDYSGRQELAPSFKDRFKLRIVPPAGEADYVALGRRLVFGEQPPVVVNGVRYEGGVSGSPILGKLRQIAPNIERFIVALARLQSSLERASMEAGERCERAVHTRRSFSDALRLMHDRLSLAAGGTDTRAAVRAAWRALTYSHFERLGVEDRRHAVDLAAACGIRADGWDLPT
jgi:AAA domain (dynein-related subfamily)